MSKQIRSKQYQLIRKIITAMENGKHGVFKMIAEYGTTYTVDHMGRWSETASNYTRGSSTTILDGKKVQAMKQRAEAGGIEFVASNESLWLILGNEYFDIEHDASVQDTTGINISQVMKSKLLKPGDKGYSATPTTGLAARRLELVAIYNEAMKASRPLLKIVGGGKKQFIKVDWSEVLNSYYTSSELKKHNEPTAHITHPQLRGNDKVLFYAGKRYAVSKTIQEICALSVDTTIYLLDDGAAIVAAGNALSLVKNAFTEIFFDKVVKNDYLASLEEIEELPPVLKEFGDYRYTVFNREVNAIYATGNGITYKIGTFWDGDEIEQQGNPQPELEIGIQVARIELSKKQVNQLAKLIQGKPATITTQECAITISNTAVARRYDGASLDGRTIEVRHNAIEKNALHKLLCMSKYLKNKYTGIIFSIHQTVTKWQLILECDNEGGNQAQHQQFIVELPMGNEPMPEAIDSSDTPIVHPIYPEAKIEDASHVTKVITSHKGSIIAVIEEHDINDITPTFNAPSILDEFDTSPIVPALPIKPTTLPELPAVIDTPKPARIDYLQDEAALASLFATLSQIVGINVMLVGTWIWIDGDTKPVKEQLKQLGFKWHQKKVMWFMALDQKYHKTRHNADWHTIAMRYGVRTLKTNV